MTKHIIVDDDELLLRSVLRGVQGRLADQIFESGSSDTVEGVHITDKVFAVEQAAHEIMRIANARCDSTVVLLDLNLGTDSSDGLDVVEMLRGCFWGTFVVHSSMYFMDKNVRAQAKKLGVRFAVEKCKLDPDVLRAAGSVANARFQTMWSAMDYLRKPIPLYRQPSDIHELLMKIWNMGMRFDGSIESLNAYNLIALECEINEHFRIASAAIRASYRSAPSRPVSEFPDMLCVYLTKMASRLSQTIADVKPFLDGMQILKAEQT